MGLQSAPPAPQFPSALFPHEESRSTMPSMKAQKAGKGASWSDVKARLTHFDHDGLVGLVHDLYAANKDNQVFLHARFGLGEDVLAPYKATIDCWLWPDIGRN